MWHASAAPLYGTFSKNHLLRVAFEALSGVGDLSKQFREWSGYAYHLRRRLTSAEQLLTGPAVDLRGSAEAVRRYQAIPAFPSEKADLMAQAETRIL